jgi:hypothetical protein
MGSLRVQTYDEAAQDLLRCEDINLIDKRRWQFAIKMHSTAKHFSVIISGSCIA